MFALCSDHSLLVMSLLPLLTNVAFDAIVALVAILASATVITHSAIFALCRDHPLRIMSLLPLLATVAIASYTLLTLLTWAYY